ncbi:hypothetical protein [Pseudomonas nitroreducens]|uniref:hypothetical protein n=1 Tax=Pseudomonas nitroreducens TaxID=46680 RepID=UPI0026588F8D|nr:hypothetical protein [Pseudomonas nitroreducens]MCP1652716.1 hypothetical protein [Pseudomonas nitroreducens]
MTFDQFMDSDFARRTTLAEVVTMLREREAAAQVEDTNVSDSARRFTTAQVCEAFGVPVAMTDPEPVPPAEVEAERQETDLRRAITDGSITVNTYRAIHRDRARLAVAEALLREVEQHRDAPALVLDRVRAFLVDGQA